MTNARTASVQVEHLTKRYGALTAVHDLSLTIPDGVVFALLGPNGAGKTTTMEILEGLRRPDEGTVRVAGMDVARNPRAVQEVVGIQLQSSAYFDLLTVRETVDLFGSFYAHRLPTAHLLEKFALTEKSRSLVRHLSGGQRQRLSVALALVNDPRIVFLDEPSAGLDPQARRVLWGAVHDMRAEGRTVVLTTHYIEEAEFLADDLAIMDRGRILARGSPRELIRRYLPGAVVEMDAVPDQDPAALGLAGVERAEVREGQWVLTTTRLEDTLGALVSWTQAQGLSLTGLRTRTATLEDVFLKLTGRHLREGGEMEDGPQTQDQGSERA
jgi:ABC-2 type transport system ATP-binding protein